MAFVPAPPAGVKVRHLLEAVSQLARVHGYGCISWSSVVTPDRLKRHVTAMTARSDPILMAVGLHPDLPWLGELNDLKPSHLPFHSRAALFSDVWPILHAAFLHSPWSFYMHGLASGFWDTVVAWLEDAASTVFLLLPKAIRQMVVQEWACISRQTAVPVDAPDWFGGWEALNMRVKSLNKYGLDIEVVMNAVEKMVFFVAFVVIHPPCKHEVQSKGGVDSNLVITACTSKFVRMTDFIYHLARMCLRWPPVLKPKVRGLRSRGWDVPVLHAMASVDCPSHVCAGLHSLLLVSFD